MQIWAACTMALSALLLSNGTGQIHSPSGQVAASKDWVRNRSRGISPKPGSSRGGHEDQLENQRYASQMDVAVPRGGCCPAALFCARTARRLCDIYAWFRRDRSGNRLPLYAAEELGSWAWMVAGQP